MDPRTAYFQKHQVPELMDNLLAKLLKAQPDNPKQFIADQLMRHVDEQYPAEYSYPFTAVRSPFGGGFSKNTASLPNLLTLEMYASLRDRHTSTGSTLENFIEDAVTDYTERDKETTVPFFFTESECFRVFQPLVDAWIATQHQIGNSAASGATSAAASQRDLNLLRSGSKRAASISSHHSGASTAMSGFFASGDSPQSGFLDSLGESPSQAVASTADLKKDDQFYFQSDPTTNRVKGGFSLEYTASAFVRLRRNIKAYRFAAGMSRAERKDLERMVKMYCPRCVSFEGGEYIDLSPQMATELEGLPQCVQPRHSTQCRTARREWPSGRGVFVTQDHLLACVIGNVEEHIEIVSLASDGNLRAAYERAFEAVRELEAELKAGGKGGYDRHPQYGFITCNPRFLGSGLTMEVSMAVPNLSKHVHIDDILKKLKVCRLNADDAPLPTGSQVASDASGDFAAGELGPSISKADVELGETADSLGDSNAEPADLADLAGVANPLQGTLVIRNEVTLKYNEWQQLQTVIEACALLAELEQALENGEEIEGKW